VLVQGVIDCYYELPDGRLRLVDYKTDYIRKSCAATYARGKNAR